VSESFDDLVDHLESRLPGSDPGAKKSPRKGPADPEKPPPASSRKRGTPPPSPEVSRDQLTPLISATFNVILERAQLEPINQTEARELATVYKPVIDKWFPWLIENYGLEIAAAGVTLKVLSPRWREWMAARADAARQPAGLPVEQLEVEPSSPGPGESDSRPVFPSHVVAP